MPAGRCDLNTGISSTHSEQEGGSSCQSVL